MNTNKYKAAMNDEKFDISRLDELCELLESCDEKKPIKVCRNKKQRLTVILAAALIISLLFSTTLVAVGANVIDTAVKTATVKSNPKESEPAPISDKMVLLEPTITSVFSCGNRVWVEISVTTNNLDLPDSIPQDVKFGFKSDSIKFITPEKDLLSRVKRNDSGVYKFIYDLEVYGVGSGRVNNAEIFLSNFGYYKGGKFYTLVKGIYYLTLQREIVCNANKLSKAAAITDEKGTVMDIELNPLGLTVRTCYSKLVEKKLHRQKTYLQTPYGLELYLNDGSIMQFYDGKDFGTLRDLILAVNTSVEYENDTAVFEYKFKSPLDIDTVEAISLCGVKICPDYPEDLSPIVDISSYYDSIVNEKWKDSIKVFAEKDIEKYANTKIISPDTVSGESKISPKITAMAGDGYSVTIQITVDANDLDIPKDIPANTMFCFKKTGLYTKMLGYYTVDKLPKQDNGVYVFNFFFVEIGDGSSIFTDETELVLEEFGYYVGKMFIPLDNSMYRYKLSEEMFDTVKDYRVVSESKEVEGVDVRLELTPVSIAMISDGNIKTRDYSLEDLEIYMRDGSIIRYDDTPEDSVYIDGGLTGLLQNCSNAGRRQIEYKIEWFGFTAPFDIDEIEAIAIAGVRFEF